jgi:hypothetical protein
VAVGGALGNAHGAAESRLRSGPNACSFPQTPHDRRGAVRNASGRTAAAARKSLRAAVAPTSARPPWS